MSSFFFFCFQLKHLFPAWCREPGLGQVSRGLRDFHHSQGWTLAANSTIPALVEQMPFSSPQLALVPFFFFFPRAVMFVLKQRPHERARSDLHALLLPSSLYKTTRVSRAGESFLQHLFSDSRLLVSPIRHGQPLPTPPPPCLCSFPRARTLGAFPQKSIFLSWQSSSGSAVDVILRRNNGNTVWAQLGKQLIQS